MSDSTLRWARPDELRRYDLRFVSRYEYPYGRTTGWQVRIARAGYRREKFFADKKWGGRRAALEACVRSRDEFERDAPPRRRPPGNPAGPGGLFRGPLGWYAWIRMGARTMSTHYSVRKWGAGGAKKQALAWLARKREERERACE